MRTLMSALLLLGGVGIVVLSTGQVRADGGPPNLDDLVFLSESLGGLEVPSDGCRAISVLDLQTMSLAFRGPTLEEGTVGRLSATDDFSMVAGGFAGYSARFYTIDWSGSAWSSGDMFHPRGRAGIAYAGIALMPGADTWLYSHSARAGQQGVLLAKHRMSDMEEGVMPPTKPPTDTLRLDGHTAGELLPLRDGRTVAAVTERGNVFLVDVPRMTIEGEPIALAPIGSTVDFRFHTRVPRTYADLSLDDRYVVTNRWDVPQLNVADLAEGRAWTLDAGSGITMTGGVAFNRGYENPGLLAVHAVSQIVVYRFYPGGELVELARVPIASVHDDSSEYEWQPGALTWSATGSHIVAVSESGASEFAVVEVSDCGRRLTKVADITACDGDVNVGIDAISANGRIAPPPAFTPVCPTPVLKPPPTATPARVPVQLPVVFRSAP